MQYIRTTEHEGEGPDSGRRTGDARPQSRPETASGNAHTHARTHARTPPSPQVNNNHLDKCRREDADLLGLHAVNVPFQPLVVEHFRQNQHGVRHERQLIRVLWVVIIVQRDPVWPRRELTRLCGVGGDVLSCDGVGGARLLPVAPERGNR